MTSPVADVPPRLSQPVRDAAAHALADQAFERSAGAALIAGNAVRLLKNAAENYPAWLGAITRARTRIHFENYILADDTTGNRFADALIERAQAGVTVRLIYDWLGVFRKASRAFWARLSEGGVDVRCFNPPRLESPLGWISRDHRKLLVVDGEVGFVSGLCVADLWQGDPARGVEPWRDTGVEIRGPALAEMERSFSRTWSMLGSRLPESELATEPGEPGDISLRIVANEPAVSGTFRLDQMLVALARKRVWITDAYYLGSPTYVQALMASARDGVDVRMLFTRSSDIPLLKLMSQTGYKTLLESGVRIFEWNGSLLHAKTAVFDGRWARVGSTNLNLASWLGNCELDAVIENEGFARQMEEMFQEDLANSTEVVLDPRRRMQRSATGGPPSRRERRGGATRAAAGAMRIGHVLGAALTNRRVFEPIETQLLLWTGLGLLVLATLFVIFPRAFAYPAGVLLVWLALAVLYRGFRLRQRRSAARARAGEPVPRAERLKADESA
jgi:cardiolipin synthase